MDPIELAGAFEGGIILASEEQRRLINDVRGEDGRGFMRIYFWECLVIVFLLFMNAICLAVSQRKL